LTLLLLGLFGLGLWNIAFAVKDFYNYDVVTSIERVNPENVTFPAITICTDGDFRKDYYVNGVRVRENVNLKGFGDLFWLAEFKTYNESKEWWDVLSVKDRLETFTIFELYQNKYCFRFNAAKNKKTEELLTSSSTKDHFIVIFRKQIEYGDHNDYYTLSFIGDKVNFYVYITDNNLDSYKTIDPIELDLPKNGYTFKLDVNSMETKLPEPYNHCKESPYNQMNCIEQCIRKEIKSFYDLPLCPLTETLFLILDPMPHILNLSIPAICAGILEAYKSYERNEYYDYCKTECPHDDCNSKKLYWNYFDDSSLFKYELSNNWIEVNKVTVLSFYIRELSYLNITQKPKTDPWTFINNIGGGLGLFMGLAIPNIVELLKFVVDILIITVVGRIIVFLCICLFLNLLFFI